MKSERRNEKRKELAQKLRRIDPTADVRAGVRQMERNRRRRIAAVLAAAAALALLSALMPAQSLLQAGSTLARNAAGAGSYVVTLTARIQGEEPIETQITVSEQALTGEDVQALFDAASEELQTALLAENEGPDYVDSALDLVTQTQDGLVEARWSFDSYDAINADGSIREDVPAEGVTTEVTLTMTYLEEEAQSIFYIQVFPPQLSEEEELEQALSEVLEEADEATASDDSYVLPQEVAGKEIIWSEPSAYLWAKVLIIGIFAAFIVWYEEREKINRSMERRDAQMLDDYAGIVDKLSLLLGAGMTLFGAWEKIVDTYDAQLTEQARPAARRTAYEEMKVTRAQIREGVSETAAYADFGRRCALRPYLKLSAILTQNLKLGTAGITRQLAAEAQEAFEQRKALARTKGEEAGTKLMIPMMMLLIVVMAIVVVPGFLSM